MGLLCGGGKLGLVFGGAGVGLLCGGSKLGLLFGGPGVGLLCGQGKLGLLFGGPGVGLLWIRRQYTNGLLFGGASASMSLDRSLSVGRNSLSQGGKHSLFPLHYCCICPQKYS